MKLVDYLAKWAEQTPHHTFVIEFGGECISYADFYRQMLLRANQLLSNNYAAGQLFVLRSSQTIDYLLTYFACHYLGVVCAPLEHDIPDAMMEQMKQRMVHYHLPEAASDVLFTSGTTGSPKGVVLSHDALMADADNLIAVHGYDASTTFIVTGPLNHFGNHSKVLPVVKSGGTLLLMPDMKSLENFFQAIDSVTQKVAAFLVPSSIRMILQFASGRLSEFASKISFIETGAAPISQADMLALAQILPKSRLFNTYASSETGVVCTYNFNDGQALPGCVGNAFPLTKVWVEDGVVVCAGKGVMMGYLGKPLHSPNAERIETCDLAYFDEEQRLHLTGRSNDAINVGGLKVYPTEIEEAALSLPYIRDCICIAAPHKVMGQVPKLLVVLAKGCTLDKRGLAQTLRLRMEAYKVPVQYEQVEVIARNKNGKLDRKHYAPAQ